jgi:hypothetical protein
VADAAPAPIEGVAQLTGFVPIKAGVRVSRDESLKFGGKTRINAPDCQGGDTETMYGAMVEIDKTVPGEEIVVAALPYGVLVIGDDKLLAGYEQRIVECDGSQTEPVGLWVGQVVPDETPEIVFVEQFGGRNMSAVTLHVYKRKDSELVEIFAAAASETEADETTEHKIELQADGRMVIDGDAKQTWQWDEPSFKYALTPSAATPPK